MKFSSLKSVMAVILTTAILVISGCASIVSKSNYPIAVNSTPSGANITVKDKKGLEVFKGNTPANFKLKAGSGYFSKARYNIEFKKDGYEEIVVPVDFSFDGWYVGNIVFGGLIGMLIVDPATGAMWKLDTEYINQTLTEITANSNQPGLKILRYDDLPESMKDKLVLIQQ